MHGALKNKEVFRIGLVDRPRVLLGLSPCRALKKGKCSKSDPNALFSFLTQSYYLHMSRETVTPDFLVGTWTSSPLKIGCFWPTLKWNLQGRGSVIRRATIYLVLFSFNSKSQDFQDPAAPSQRRLSSPSYLPSVFWQSEKSVHQSVTVGTDSVL